MERKRRAANTLPRAAGTDGRAAVVRQRPRLVERGGTLYECASCGHQTSLTSGTLFHGTRKPLRLWFRAIWEICVHRHGISAADLQRVLGLGSYETAWAWAHRIRRAMVREHRGGLQGSVQVDETFVGGKNGDKAMVMVAAEEGGRLRLIHAPGNHEDCIKHIADEQIETDAAIKTDGHAAYNARTLNAREHDVKVQSAAERKSDDHVQLCHWAAGWPQALATRHASWRCQRQAFAVLPRRARLSTQSPQDQRRWPACRAMSRKHAFTTTAHHAPNHSRHSRMPRIRRCPLLNRIEAERYAFVAYTVTSSISRRPGTNQDRSSPR